MMIRFKITDTYRDKNILNAICDYGIYDIKEEFKEWMIANKCRYVLSNDESVDFIAIIIPDKDTFSLFKSKWLK